MFYPFFDNSLHQKDSSFIKCDPVFNIRENDLFSGPKKSSGTQYMLYIARGDKKILNYDEKEFNDDNDLETETE